jgi:DNA-binding winged helix-turn-helix (wHTH) protein/tetratricopeptide (TPR) repeat protein
VLSGALRSHLDSLSISFPPFLLDLGDGRLLREGKAVPLRRKTWEVLCRLARRPGELVTKDDLMDAVWADVVVAEVTLSTSIRELRQALGDDARSPRYIETVHRRGFRFIARPEAVPASAIPVILPSAAPAKPRRRQDVPPLVGRESELRLLRGHLDLALGGKPQVVLLRGEAGSGKSALVSAFLAELARSARHPAPRVAVGRCVGFLHGAPPYLPVTEAIESLATRADSAVVVEALERHAPEILAQMPWLRPREAATALPSGRGRRDLSRELAMVVAAIGAAAPLVLVLEDLHDSDTATLDFLVEITRLAEGSRVLVIGTWRTAEAIVGNPALTETIRTIAERSDAILLDLELLGYEEVRVYLGTRDGELWSEAMAREVHRHSGGNPLFMVALADTVDRTGILDDGLLAGEVPESLRGMLEAQLRGLEFQQREVLAAASVAGAAFSSLAVAPAAGMSVEAVEAVCETLAGSGRFLRATGISDWPSGAVGQSYAFRHELYRKALYDAQPLARRTSLHQRIGETLEAGYASATAEIANDLADHFERSGDTWRAISYLREAATVARQRFAHREALRLLDAASSLLGSCEEGTARDEVEFRIEVDRAASAGALHGHGSAEARRATGRAELLSRSLEASVERFLSLLVLFSFQMIRAEVIVAGRLAEEMTSMADELDSPILRLGALSCTAMVETTRGDIVDAREHFQEVLDQVPREFRLPNFRDVLVPSMTGMAQTLSYLGEAEAARRISMEAIERSDWLGDHFERSCARVYDGYRAALAGDREGALAVAAEGREIAREHGIEEMAAIGDVLIGWASQREDIDERRRRMRSGLEGIEVTGHLIGKDFYLSLLADVEIEAGDPEAAASVVRDALEFCDSSGAGRHRAVLLRQLAAIEHRRGAGAQGR